MAESHAAKTEGQDGTVKSGKRTLLTSVLLSSAGPLVLGIGAFIGRSSTQIADLVRRTAEFLAILFSYLVFRSVNGGEAEDVDVERKNRLERRVNLFMGAVMVVSGCIMAAVAILVPSSHDGNVIPGLIIAGEGLAVNCFFWRKYTKLHRQGGDAIMAAQSKLYRAKTAVDTCVFLALACVFLFPDAPFTGLVDTVGSLIVAAYLIYSGIGVIRSQDSDAVAQ